MASRKPPRKAGKAPIAVPLLPASSRNAYFPPAPQAADLPESSPETIYDEIHEALATVKPKYARLKALIAEIVDLAPAQISPKMISSSNQLSPRLSESSMNKSRSEADEWVFVGLFQMDEQLSEGMLATLRRELGTFASLGIIFDDDSEWHVRKIYYAPEYERTMERVRSLFSVPVTDCEMLRARPAAGGAAAKRPARQEGSDFGVDEAIRDLFISEEEFQKILDIFERKKNLILQGPPGVGKSFIAKRLAYALIGSESPERVTTIQFHQGYSYEDFVQGWRPAEEGGFELKEGIFYLFCSEKAATDETGSRYVFIIDEINRGNLSKIFGELMVLIEPDKRGEDFAIPLTYSTDESETFFVPENVYVLGLMNTADRSLAMVDYALRRRFAFYDLKPAFGEESFTDFLLDKGIDPDVVDRINTRMEALNERIVNDRKNLGPGYQIGHSFFCPTEDVEPPGDDWYKQVVESEIAPLLREYWFDEGEAVEELVQELLA